MCKNTHCRFYLEKDLVKKEPLKKGVFPTIYPMLDVPATPPSGDSSEY